MRINPWIVGGGYVSTMLIQAFFVSGDLRKYFGWQLIGLGFVLALVFLVNDLTHRKRSQDEGK